MIDQIIDLKKKCKNTFNETYAQLYRHYKVALVEIRKELDTLYKKFLTLKEPSKAQLTQSAAC